ncbi:hypothetical protein NBRC116188_17690 [Oceaniserpentilla sp. 4NH20-0058]|uniref:hypothetical protein n=1 Tax=Oceaniserpentilla sp. 4NH20-0058 TaxID=3127660 RepID=UPI0031098EAE
MSVDSWQPVKPPSQLSQAQLNQLFTISQGQPKECDFTSELEFIQPLAHLDKKIWEEIADSLDQNQQINLIGLFTLAEEQGNWYLGEKSPVIPLFKALRRQHGIDKPLVKWVKSHTQNKFLPFGPLL